MTKDEILAALEALPPYRRHQALRIGCEDALAVWRRYRLDGAPLVYSDSIVGLEHVVDDTLPARALADIDNALAGERTDDQINGEYLEPITAIHDDDLDLPAPIYAAYSAIYQLHGMVIGATGTKPLSTVLRYLLQGASATEAWISEWWTKVWDAWASTPEPAAVSMLSEHAFEALAAGDPDRALELLEPGFARAAVLLLAGKLDEAIDLATATLGARPTPELRHWLGQYLGQLAPDALAVSRDRTTYAVIRGDTLVHKTKTGSMARSVSPSCVLRRVRQLADGDVCVAGDRIDAQGVWASFTSDVRDRIADKTRDVLGVRTIIAVGDNVFSPAHPSRALICVPPRALELGELPVVAAAISEDNSIVVTHDDVRVSVWHRDPASCQRVARTGLAPCHIALGGSELLIVWSDGSSTISNLTSG